MWVRGLNLILAGMGLGLVRRRVRLALGDFNFWEIFFLFNFYCTQMYY
jgi:hypothetical protein